MFTQRNPSDYAKASTDTVDTIFKKKSLPGYANPTTHPVLRRSKQLRRARQGERGKDRSKKPFKDNIKERGMS
jgi:hypothetical protein